MGNRLFSRDAWPRWRVMNCSDIRFGKPCCRSLRLNCPNRIQRPLNDPTIDIAQCYWWRGIDILADRTMYRRNQTGLDVYCAMPNMKKKFIVFVRNVLNSRPCRGSYNWWVETRKEYRAGSFIQWWGYNKSYLKKKITMGRSCSEESKYYATCSDRTESFREKTFGQAEDALGRRYKKRCWITERGS